MNNKIFYSFVLSIAIAAPTAFGQNLLLDGDFEPAGGGIPNWQLEEFVTGNNNDINSGELSTFNNTQDGDQMIWFRGFSGGEDPGPDNLTNAILSQTVDILAGNNYTFSGYSRFEANYSGGVDTLDSSSPLGAVPSPTETEFTLEFLDGSGSPVGSSVIFDVKQDRLAQVAFPILGANDNNWYQHVLPSTMAPVGATQARVSASAIDMVWQVGANQSAFVDAFSLTDDADPGTELLFNPGVDEPTPTGLENWVIMQEDPADAGNESVVRGGSQFAFANHTPGGTSGVWLSSFFGEEETPVDGSVSQTVDATSGEDYRLTGWSRWETFFTADSAFIDLEFLDEGGGVLDTLTVDVGSARTTLSPTSDPNDGEWYQHELTGTSPANTSQIRVSAGMVDGIEGAGNPQSAFFDDFVLELVGGSTPGDFDGDGDVDGTDFLVWQQGGSPNPGSAGDLADWQGNYGANALSASFANVPEPTSLLLLATFTGLACGCRKRS